MTSQLIIDFDALMARAESRGELDRLEGDLVKLAYLFSTNFDFRLLIRSNRISIENRIESVLEVADFSAAQTFVELLFIIISERYFNRIQLISDRVTDMISKRSNRYLVVFGTSKALSSDEQDEVGARISSAVGRSITLRNDVDARLIAGSFIKLPDGKVFDYSVRRQLSEFKSYLMENA